MYEWNGFGHKFKSRQHYSSNKESSPVFVQFLDCLNQIRKQHASQFEFKEELLEVLARAYMDNMFEEFGSNSTQQLIEYDQYVGSQEERALSIWSIIESNPTPFVNDTYKPVDSHRVLDIDTHAYSLSVWCRVYNTFNLSNYRL